MVILQRRRDVFFFSPLPKIDGPERESRCADESSADRDDIRPERFCCSTGRAKQRVRAVVCAIRADRRNRVTDVIDNPKGFEDGADDKSAEETEGEDASRNAAEMDKTILLAENIRELIDSLLWNRLFLHGLLK